MEKFGSIIMKPVGLENVQRVRYGVIHSNSVINSPKASKESYKTKVNDKQMYKQM